MEDKKETNRICNDCSHDDGHSNDCTRWSVAAEFKKAGGGKRIMALYPKSQWQWIDGNKDGIAECYYFDGSGYMLSNTTTPDGYVVNGDGAWTEGGAVKTKNVSTEPVTANTSNDTVTNSQAPATDVYSGTYAYNIGTYSFSMKIVYDPATKTLTDTEWLPGFGGVTDTYHYAGVNEMGYTVFKMHKFE